MMHLYATQLKLILSLISPQVSSVDFNSILYTYMYKHKQVDQSITGGVIISRFQFMYCVYPATFLHVKVAYFISMVD